MARRAGNDHDANAHIALQRESMQAKKEMSVSSGSFDGQIPSRFSEYAAGLTPELSWNRIAGAKSYALIVEDPDAPMETPYVHWTAWNIPAEVTTIPEGRHLEGVPQGRTTGGQVGYFGPRPPVGDEPHHYHFQVFALDDTLDLPAGAERDDLLAAMEGHVLAAGEVVGTYQQKLQPSL